MPKKRSQRAIRRYGTVVTAPKQVTIWMDYKHYDDGSMVWGIECDNADLTFDGHFLCLFPKHVDEQDDSAAFERGLRVIKAMCGQGGQFLTTHNFA